MLTTLPQSVIIRNRIIIGPDTKNDKIIELNFLNFEYDNKIISGPNPTKIMIIYLNILSKVNNMITAWY